MSAAERELPFPKEYLLKKCVLCYSALASKFKIGVGDYRQGQAYPNGRPQILFLNDD